MLSVPVSAAARSTSRQSSRTASGTPVVVSGITPYPVPCAQHRACSLLGQLADVELAAASRGHLAELPEPERRAAAIEGLRYQDWSRWRCRPR
jgi:hypothetical protein